MTHYDTLDVDKKASPDDIKKAFRKKARKHHPDAGGDANEMVKVNKAYATLSDEDKRKHYDETGDDIADNSIESEANSLLSQLFTECLQKDIQNPVQFVESFVAQNVSRLDTQIANTEAAKEKIMKRRANVTTEDANNLFTAALDTLVTAFSNQLIGLNRGRSVVQKVSEAISKYSTTEVSPQMRTSTMYHRF